MKAGVQTADGVLWVDLEAEEIVSVDGGARLPPASTFDVSLPRVITATGSGSTVIALVDRRPPLVVSYDAGRTWSEAGGGLPAGRAVAVASDNPDIVLFAARNRLYLSRDGGRFWRALVLEIPAIEAIELFK